MFTDNRDIVTFGTEVYALTELFHSEQRKKTVQPTVQPLHIELLRYDIITIRCVEMNSRRCGIIKKEPIVEKNKENSYAWDE